MSDDFATDLSELQPLAEQGDANARNNLGEMYSNGYGVPQDGETALKWVTLGAEQGDAYAQYSLGLMYAGGTGVPQDNVYAHMWGHIAAVNGSENGGNLRGLIAKEMTAAQIEKAEELAREFTRKENKGC